MCNRVLAGAMKSLQDSVRGIMRDFRLPLQKLEADMAKLEDQCQDLAHDNATLRAQCKEIKLQLNLRQVHKQVHTRAGTQSRASLMEVRATASASRTSSRNASLCPLDRAGLVHWQAQMCASNGDYHDMVTKTQQLSVLTKGLSSREHSRQPSMA